MIGLYIINQNSATIRTPVAVSHQVTSYLAMLGNKYNPLKWLLSLPQLPTITGEYTCLLQILVKALKITFSFIPFLSDLLFCSYHLSASHKADNFQTEPDLLLWTGIPLHPTCRSYPHMVH